MTAQVRALLTALGYDDAHAAVVRHRPHAGLCVSLAGKPVRFYTLKQLRALEDDAEVVRDFTEALPPEPE